MRYDSGIEFRKAFTSNGYLQPNEVRTGGGKDMEDRNLRRLRTEVDDAFSEAGETRGYKLDKLVRVVQSIPDVDGLKFYTLRDRIGQESGGNFGESPTIVDQNRFKCESS